MLLYKIKYDKIYNYLIISLLILACLSTLIDYYLQIKILSYSFFVTVLPTFIVLSTFIFLTFNTKDKRLKNDIIINILNIIIVILISLMRTIYYTENVNLISVIFPIYALLILTLSKYYNPSPKQGKFIIYFLIFTLIFFASISLLRLLGLPTIEVTNTNAGDYVNLGRYSGIMGGANVYANITITIFLIIVLSSYLKSRSIKIFLFIICFIAISPTISKLAFLLLIVIGIYLPIGTERKIFVYIFTGTLISIMWLIVISYWEFLNIDDYLFRFQIMELSNDSRVDKVYYTIKMLFSNAVHIILGIPNKYQSSSVINISDNSFTLILANYGLLYLIFIIKIFYKKIKEIIAFKNHKAILLLTIFLIFTVNNSLLWLNWVVLVGFGIRLMPNK